MGLNCETRPSVSDIRCSALECSMFDVPPFYNPAAGSKRQRELVDCLLAIHRSSMFDVSPLSLNFSLSHASAAAYEAHG